MINNSNNQNSSEKKTLVYTILAILIIIVLISITIILAKKAYNGEIFKKQLNYISENDTVTASSITESINEEKIKMLNNTNIQINILNNNNKLQLEIINNLQYAISVRFNLMEEFDTSEIKEENKIPIIAASCESNNKSISNIDLNKITKNTNYKFSVYIRDMSTGEDCYKTAQILLRYEDSKLVIYSTSELIPLNKESITNLGEEITEESTEESTEIVIQEELNTENTKETEEELDTDNENIDESNNENTLIKDSYDILRKDTRNYETITPWTDEYKSKIGDYLYGYLYLNTEVSQLANNQWQTKDGITITFLYDRQSKPSETVTKLNQSLLDIGYSQDIIKTNEIYCEESGETINGQYTDEMYQLILNNDPLISVYEVFNFPSCPSTSIIIEMAFPGEYTTEQISEFVRCTLRNYRTS